MQGLSALRFVTGHVALSATADESDGAPVSVRRYSSRNRSSVTAMMQSIFPPHARSADAVVDVLQGSRHGLSQAEATARLERYGPNRLPRARPPGLAQVFLRQFASPLIYVLLAAALLSLSIRHWSDAGFIFAVLLLNAVIGTLQEFSAQRAAQSLGELVATRCRVLRGGDSHEIDATGLVTGDIVLLEAGDRVPADPGRARVCPRGAEPETGYRAVAATAGTFRCGQW